MSGYMHCSRHRFNTSGKKQRELTEDVAFLMPIQSISDTLVLELVFTHILRWILKCHPLLFTTLRRTKKCEEQKQELKEVFDLCPECVLSLVSGCVNVARCRVGNWEQLDGSNKRGMMSMDQLLSTTLSSRRNVFGDCAITPGFFAICKRLQTYFTQVSESVS